MDEDELLEETLSSTNEIIEITDDEEQKDETIYDAVEEPKEDEKMIEEAEWDTTLKIGILDNNTLDVLNIYKEAFDIVLTGKDATFDIFKEIVK